MRLFCDGFRWAPTWQSALALFGELGPRCLADAKAAVSLSGLMDTRQTTKQAPEELFAVLREREIYIYIHI